MLALFMGLGIWWRVGIVVAFVAVVVGAIWGIHHSIYTKGYRAAEAELKPIIEKQKVDLTQAKDDIAVAQKINKEFQSELTRLHTLTVEQQKSIDFYKAATLEAEIKVRKALLAVAEKEKKYTAEIARLVAIAAGPPLTEGAVDEADAILRSLARDRLFVAGGAPASGGSAAPAKGGARRSGGG